MTGCGHMATLFHQDIQTSLLKVYLIHLLSFFFFFYLSDKSIFYLVSI
jgi:hypothetical protein